MPEENKSSSKFLIGGILILVLAVASYGVSKYMKKGDAIVTTPLEGNNDVVPPVALPKSAYKDGTYTSDGMYVSPGGDEKINVTLVLKDDVVVDATVKSLATRPTSVKMQTAFISGYKTLVIGKKITEVTLTKVSGSSLTPKGWNDAVAKIQAEAKA